MYDTRKYHSQLEWFWLTKMFIFLHKIFSIKYSCPCGTNVESKKIVDKGVGFYKWARGLTKKDFRTIKWYYIPFHIEITKDKELDEFLDKIKVILASCERLIDLGVSIEVVEGIMISVTPCFEKDDAEWKPKLNTPNSKSE